MGLRVDDRPDCLPDVETLLLRYKTRIFAMIMDKKFKIILSPAFADRFFNDCIDAGCFCTVSDV